MEEAAIAWGVAFRPRVMLGNAAAAARGKIEDRSQPPLEDAAQAALDSILTLHGLMILITAEGRELSDEADRMGLTWGEQAKLIANAQDMAAALRGDTQIIASAAVELVGRATEIMNAGSHPERGKTFGLATVKMSPLF